MANVGTSTDGGRAGGAADAAARSAGSSDSNDGNGATGTAGGPSTADSLGRSPSTSESLSGNGGARDRGAAAATGTATVDVLAGGVEPSRAEAGDDPSAVDRAASIASLAPDGLALTARGIESTGYRTQVDNPALSVQWESTRSATTGRGGFTTGARAKLEAAGIDVIGTVNGIPAGSLGPYASPPTAAGNAHNTHNGDLARDQIAARFTAPNQRVTPEFRYDANLHSVSPEVRNRNVRGDRNVDVQIDIEHPTDPRLNERIEIESKAFRVDAGSVGDSQLAHDAARLSRNGALRRAGTALEGFGRVARPVGIALDAAEVYSAFRADGDAVGINTARAGTSLVAGGAGGWSGATVGAAIGTAALPGVGTAVGAIVGGTIGAIAGSELAKGAFDTVRGWFS